jgi:hypothetical protein
MVPRKSDLNRRYQRKDKLRKLRRKLATPTLNETERAAVLAKIKSISPRWKPPAAK